MQIDKPEHLLGLLGDRLRAADLPPEMIKAATAYLADQLAPETISGSVESVVRFSFQPRGYIIKDEDLDLLDESIQFTFAASIAGLGIFDSFTPSAFLGIAQVAYTSYRISHRIRKKAAPLTRDQYAVVCVLQAAGKRATKEEMARVLESRNKRIDRNCSAGYGR